MSHFTLLLLVATLSCHLHTAVAPFPPNNPLNALNPVIEPWWERLTKDEQKHIYAGWERIEPVALALAEAMEAKLRAKETLRRLVVTKAKHLYALAKEAYASHQKGDQDSNVRKGDSFRSVALELGETTRAESLEFLHWKQASKAAKKAALLQKLSLLSKDDGKKAKPDSGKKY